MIRMPIRTTTEIYDQVIDCIHNLRSILKKYNHLILSQIEPLITECDKSDWDGWYTKYIHRCYIRDIFCTIFAIDSYINELKLDDISDNYFRDYSNHRFFVELKDWCDNLYKNDHQRILRSYIKLGDSLGELIDPIPQVIDIIECRILSLKMEL